MAEIVVADVGMQSLSWKVFLVATGSEGTSLNLFVLNAYGPIFLSNNSNAPDYVFYFRRAHRWPSTLTANQLAVMRVAGYAIRSLLLRVKLAGTRGDGYGASI